MQSDTESLSTIPIPSPLAHPIVSPLEALITLAEGLSKENPSFKGILMVPLANLRFASRAKNAEAKPSEETIGTMMHILSLAIERTQHTAVLEEAQSLLKIADPNNKNIRNIKNPRLRILLLKNRDTLNTAFSKKAIDIGELSIHMNTLKKCIQEHNLLEILVPQDSKSEASKLSI